MGRKPRLELEGGLYHVMSRGNNRRRIFDDEGDYSKMLKVMKDTKIKLPFYLYVYCLMPNHIHLVIEQQQAAISRIMHHLLKEYSRYYNRRNKRTGHLFKERYRSILCQSDQYLSELVRYIHLNPVRAKIVNDPAAFRYSSHRAYLGFDQFGLVDVEPVLRHFGATKMRARQSYKEFVKAGMKLGRREDIYGGEDNRLLGSEEFVEGTKKRVGKAGKMKVKKYGPSDLEQLMDALTEATDLTREQLCNGRKKREVVIAKEAFIVVAREVGANNSELARLLGIESSTVSRRFEAGEKRIKGRAELDGIIKEVRKRYRSKSEI